MSLLRTSSRALSSVAASKPDVSSGLKPFEAIPAMPKGLPILGNFTLFIKPHGFKRANENGMSFFERHDPDGYGMVRGKSKLANPFGEGNLLLIRHPQDVEVIYRNEGKYPFRGDPFISLKKWRGEHPEWFGETLGVLIEDNERWQEVRSIVQQDMMRPKSAMFYVDKIQDTAEELVDFIRRERNDDKLYPGDMVDVCNKFAFEAICKIALDTRLGALDENVDPGVEMLIEAMKDAVEGLGQVMTSIPYWLIHPRLSPSYMKMARGLDTFVEYAGEKILAAGERAKKTMHDPDRDKSVLEKLILKCGPDSKIPFVMAFDMVGAGIDTTGNSSAFLLYNLAANQDKQEILRKEILSFDTKITEKSLNQMKYLRAFMKENSRWFPLTVAGGRVMPEDFELAGHLIPKHTSTFWFNKRLAFDPQYIKDPHKFQPERWLRGSADLPHPFTVLPFSHGPRMCIGKRFAELELQLFVCKLLQNYRVEWAGEKELGMELRLFNMPDAPVKIRFHDL